MIRSVIKNLIADADPETVAANSFRDFHARGIEYLCLNRTPTFTAKLYLFDPKRIVHNADHILVNPHSHAYNFSTYVLCGDMSNVKYRWISGEGWHRFNYSTPLNGGNPESAYVGPCGLFPYDIEHLGEGDSCTMDHTEIHSIRVSTLIPTALFLFQHADQQKPFTSLFMRKANLPCLDGLYGRFAAAEVEERLSLLGHAIGKD